MGNHKTRTGLVLVCLAALLVTLLIVVAGAGAAPRVATAAGPAPGAVADEGFGWIVQLRGAARSEGMTYEQLRALAALHPASWTDDNKTPDDPSDDVVYSGVPLWRLIARIDDATPGSFNDTLAAKDYAVQVIGLDGFTATFTSSQLARKDDIIVADLANGLPLPMGTIKAGTPGPPPTLPSWKPAWPIKLCSASLPGNQKPAGIARVVVYAVGVTPPSTPPTSPWAWMLQLRGARSVDESGTQIAHAGHQVPGLLGRQQQDARRPERRPHLHRGGALASARAGR